MENNKKESSLFHCSSYGVPYLQYPVLLIPPPQRCIMVREKVRRDIAKVIRETEWLLSEDSDNADKVMQQTSVKLSKAWRRQTRNDWSQQLQQRALGEAGSCRNGNKRIWLFTWRGQTAELLTTGCGCREVTSANEVTGWVHGREIHQGLLNLKPLPLA